MSGLFNIVMRIVSSLLGLLLIVIGSVWTMQGLNIGPDAILQGFMVGDIHWTIYGTLLVLVGIGQVAWSNMRRA